MFCTRDALRNKVWHHALFAACPETCLGNCPCLNCLLSFSLLLQVFYPRIGIRIKELMTVFTDEFWVLWNVQASRGEPGPAGVPRAGLQDVVRTMSSINVTTQWRHAVEAGMQRPYLMCQKCEVRPRMLHLDFTQHQRCDHCLDQFPE